MALLALCTVTGDDGVNTCFIDARDVVADFGAIQPGITATMPESPDGVTLSTPVVNTAERTVRSQNKGSVTFAAGELVTFTVTVTSSARRDILVDIEYECGSPATLHDHERFLILQRPYRVG